MTGISVRERLDAALMRIDDLRGEGMRACLTVYREAARGAADAADARARAGISLGPLDGAIVTIKDLFDVAGEVTRAGSKVLAEEGKPAQADAPVVHALRAGGAVIVAKTNMTEFAFSGVGINPHFGTPGNPADRTRIPGGSTSGGAVAVADGMCEIAIGSDTGGSLRIPGALCGLVGFKPTGSAFPSPAPFRYRKASTRSGQWRTPSSTVRRPTRSWPATASSRSIQPRSRTCASALRKACRWKILTRRWPNDFRRPSTSWSRPAAGYPTKSWRCSTA